jgi:cation/acetate symporter
MNKGAPTDLVVAGTSRLALFASLAIAAFFLILAVSGQAGLPDRFAMMVTAGFFCLVFAMPGIASRTASLETWQTTGKLAAPYFLAMAVSVPLISAQAYAGLAGNIAAGAGGAAAHVLGPLCGFAISALILTPYLRKSGAVSPPAFFALRYSSAVPGAVFAGLFALSAFLFLWSQLSIAGSAAASMTGLGKASAVAGMAILVAIIVVPGGIGATIRAGSLAFMIMALAMLAPLVWLSAVRTGIPIPQVAEGLGALSDLAELESQLAGLGLRPLANGIETALPAANAVPEALLLFLCLALGFVAFPPVLGHFVCVKRSANVLPASASAIVFTALILTAVPAMASFGVIGIYNSIFGLTVSEIPAAARWIFGFGGQTAPLSVAEPLLTLCGRQVTDVAAAIAACGGDPDYALGPGDLRIRGEIFTLALGPIFNMPHALMLAAGAATAAAALASACMAAFAFSASASTRYPVSGMNRLFVNRLLVVMAIAAAAWLCIAMPMPGLQAAWWSIAVATGCLTPAFLLSIWWDRMHAAAAFVGMAAAAVVLSGFAAMQAFGPDLVAGSGDEWQILAFSLPIAIVAGVCAALANGIASASFALLINRKADAEMLEFLRVPDAPAPGKKA